MIIENLAEANVAKGLPLQRESLTISFEEKYYKTHSINLPMDFNASRDLRILYALCENARDTKAKRPEVRLKQSNRESMVATFSCGR